MPLEAVMVCIDTSEHMRNGDFVPTRHESQQDAANLIVGAKMQANPENSVGVLSMASTGRCAGAKVLVSPTDDMGKILSSLHDAKVAGKVNFVESVQVAQLALKHRRNKNGSQRIILFVGSPIEAEEAALVKAAKLLKKNNIAVDIVLLGEDDASNSTKLAAFVEAANSNNNSNLVTIPAGVAVSDALVSSRVIQQEGATDGGGGGDAGFAAPSNSNDFGGVDANLDPELAMALRVSMEMERSRQDAANATEAAPAPAADEAEAAPSVPAAAVETTMDTSALANLAEDDDALLQQALAMSMNEAQAVAAAQAAAAPPVEVAATTMEVEEEEEDDDETMQQALAMSMSQSTEEAAPALFNDPSFVEQMLSQLPGVDVNDPQIQAALARIQGGASSEEAKKDEKK